ncbi:putative uncharacterized protein C7orf78 homolog [Parambassis ranga]|uniref:Uncharacterized protein n=1 Tax=Parambassis ranga TaxID=210632 RepID=A0A6P7K085_9TELE|nr:uncharacterized protein LOC114448432 [Parambassis ranga]
MAPNSLSLPLSSVSFERKIQFSASQDLSFTRSKCLKPTETPSLSDVWSIKPPDFSVKLYSRLSVPHQTAERRTDPTPAFSQPGEIKKSIKALLPNVVYVNPKKDPPKFIAPYKPPDTLESELMFVRMGKYPTGPYKNPKPHNFRPLDEDLPNVITTYERDPGNLNLKLKALDTLQSIESEIHSSVTDTKAQMDTYKPAEPKWDGRLILPPLPWPPKSASYTRHRRRRGAYSAFLDRVEAKLSESWKNNS